MNYTVEFILAHGLKLKGPSHPDTGVPPVTPMVEQLRGPSSKPPAPIRTSVSKEGVPPVPSMSTAVAAAKDRLKKMVRH